MRTERMHKDVQGWAFVPEDGRPPRLIRYTTINQEGVLSVLDVERNILHIDRERASFLSDRVKEKLEGTNMQVTELEEFGGSYTFSRRLM